LNVAWYTERNRDAFAGRRKKESFTFTSEGGVAEKEKVSLSWK